MSECGWFGAIHDCGLGFSLATSYSGVKTYWSLQTISTTSYKQRKRTHGFHHSNGSYRSGVPNTLRARKDALLYNSFLPI